MSQKNRFFSGFWKMHQKYPRYRKSAENESKTSQMHISGHISAIRARIPTLKKSWFLVENGDFRHFGVFWPYTYKYCIWPEGAKIVIYGFKSVLYTPKVLPDTLDDIIWHLDAILWKVQKSWFLLFFTLYCVCTI